MSQTKRWLGASLLLIGGALLALVGSNVAQDKKPYEKHDTSALYNSLRDVINAGAKMFNEQGDHAGCYRLYQGSLLAVRPFLAPDLQKKIDGSLASAEKLASYSDRAFELRRVLDDIRDKTKPIEKKKVDDKKKEEKKDKKDDKKKDEKKDKKDDKKKDEKKDKKDDKKKDEKKDKKDEKKAAASNEKGQVAGKLALEGKPIAGGYFVTLVAADGKKFSSALQKDGSYQFKTPIPVGEYRIAVEAIPGETILTPLPKRYSSETKSGLAIRVLSGKQLVDLDLVK